MQTILKGVDPKGIDLEDGAYKGTIKTGEVRQVEGKDYSYYDIYLSVEGQEG